MEGRDVQDAEAGIHGGVQGTGGQADEVGPERWGGGTGAGVGLTRR